MKSMILMALLAGGVAGGGAALVAGTVLSGEAGVAASTAVSPDDDPALVETVKQLQEQNEALAERLRRLETQLAMVRPERQREVASEPEPELAQAEELKELVAALRDPSAPPPANFQQSVSRALESIREQEDRERDERRDQAYQERLDERLTELSLALGLNQGQKNDLRDVFVDMNARQREMMDAARELNDWSSARDQMRELRDGMEQALARVLTPSQLEQYNELGGGGRGFGGPGGGMLPPSPSDHNDRNDRGDRGNRGGDTGDGTGGTGSVPSGGGGGGRRRGGN